MFGRTTRRERRRLMDRLVELRLRHQVERRWAVEVVDDYILYAAHGKDRKKLGMEWADECEAQIRRVGELREWAMRRREGEAA